MNHTLRGVELAAHWRNSGEQDNPAGPLFAAGEFAEVDITNDCGGLTPGCGGRTYSTAHACAINAC